jgi:predicted HD superfamily hydrolase involved in NAD metabolism
MNQRCDGAGRADRVCPFTERHTVPDRVHLQHFKSTRPRQISIRVAIPRGENKPAAVIRNALPFVYPQRGATTWRILRMRWKPEWFRHVTDSLESRLDRKRFLHSLGVVQTAVILARTHQCDVWRAAVAALLHDCAKRADGDSAVKDYCERFGTHPYLESDLPQLLHAVAGAGLAMTEFGVEDEEILDAIAWHPTGHARPSATLLVLLAADYCEPSRDFPGVKEIRQLVRQNLVGGVREILKRKARYVEETGRSLHPATREALLSLQPQ